MDTPVGSLFSAYEGIKALDVFYETMTLNHVAKRASKSQGMSLLTLRTKGLSPPTPLPIYQTTTRDTFVGELKLRIRREEMQGHLPICSMLGSLSPRSMYFLASLTCFTPRVKYVTRLFTSFRG